MTRRLESISQPDSGGDDDAGDLTHALRTLSDRTTGKFDLNQDQGAMPKAMLICRDNAAKKWGVRWLRQFGFDVSIVPEGLDAREFARAHPPDVIVVEAWLKNSNGERLVSELQDMADIDAPLFALCNSAQEVAYALEAEVYDIVRKPFDWQLLSRRAQKLVGQLRREEELEQTREYLKSALEVANRARRQLRKSESFEPVTGLPNRNKFLDLITRGIGAAQRDDIYLAVFTVTFSRFRMVLEALGRDQANSVIAEISARLNECLRAAIDSNPKRKGLRTAAIATTGIGRFSLMLTCSPDKEESKALRREITRELSRPATISGQTIYLSTCTGAAFYPQDAVDADALLLRTEAAVRDAQARGADFRFFCADMDAEAARKLDVEQKLHIALERGELKLAYQPLNDVLSNQIVATEALLRWPQPDGSFISPEEFVPIAEDAGLMNRMGEFVLDEACRQLKSWHTAGLDYLRMAVNVAKCQLMDDAFPGTVANCLEKHGLNPSFIELELSERGVLSNDEDISKRLYQLKILGVTLSVDDFGTGDSSIAYFKDLPIDTLKIDRSYIAEMTEGGRHNKMIAAMIAIAQRLDMTIIAEGVETAAQLNLLQSLGCDQYQGFYRSAAVAPDAIVELLRESP